MDVTLFIFLNSSREKMTLVTDSTPKTMATVNSSLIPRTKSTSNGHNGKRKSKQDRQDPEDLSMFQTHKSK